MSGNEYFVGFNTEQLTQCLHHTLHIKRAAYQAGHCWSQAIIPDPSLNDWGWRNKLEEGFEACWTALPEASQACRELIQLYAMDAREVVGATLRYTA